MIKGEIRQIKKKIGEGGQGKVYLATYIMDPKKPKNPINAALKQIDQNKINLEEIKLHSKISKYPKCNEYIACFYEFFQHPITKDYFIIMEYIPGTDLNDYIATHHLTEQQIYNMFVQALQGLSFIHEHGIVHGDIKLENFIMDENEKKMKYIDFGFGCSKFTCKRHRVLHGTSYLNPPETPKYLKKKLTFHAIEQADLWALGSTFAEIILTNKRGTVTRTDDVGLDAKHIDNKISSKLFPETKNSKTQTMYNVIDQMMSVNPNSRKSANELLNELTSF